MGLGVDEVINLKIKCFNCENAYGCKYYQNPIWDWYMVNNPQDGCPAEKYSFDSLYYVLLEEKEKEKNGRRYGNRR